MGSDLVSVVQGSVTSMLVQFQALPEFLQGFNLCTKGTALNCWLTKTDSSSAEAYRHRTVGRRTREMPVREVTLPLLSIFLVLLLNWKAPHSLFAALLPSSFPSSPMAMSSHGLNLCPQHSLPHVSSPSLPGCWAVFCPLIKDRSYYMKEVGFGSLLKRTSSAGPCVIDQWSQPVERLRQVDDKFEVKAGYRVSSKPSCLIYWVSVSNTHTYIQGFGNSIQG